MVKSPRLFAMIFCLVFICLFPEFIQAEELEIRVMVQKANIRIGPSTQSEIVLLVSIGTVLKSITKEGNWYKLILPPDKNGIERSGYIHSNIVEVITKPSEPLKVPIKEPVKEAPKIVEQAKDIAEKPELPAKIPEITQPPIMKKDSKISEFLGKFNLRLSGGLGFLFNGGGDIEKLRTGTEELMDSYAAIPGYTSGFDWTKLRGTTNFNISLSYNITPKISVGLSSGYIGASSKNNEYSFGFKFTESSGFSENENSGPLVFGNNSFSPDDTRTLEAWWNYNWAYTLFAVPLYLNLYYNLPSCSSPRRPFYPYAWIGFGPNFCKLKLNSSELYGHTDTYSPYYYPDIIDKKERNINVEQIGNKVAFGINTGVGAYIRLLSNMFLGLSLQLNTLSLRNMNTQWTEEGSENHTITDEAEGLVFEESDSWERTGKDRLDFGELGNKITGGKEPFLGYVSPDTLAGHWDGRSRDPAGLNLNQVRALFTIMICLGRTGFAMPIDTPIDRGDDSRCNKLLKKGKKKGKNGGLSEDEYRELIALCPEEEGGWSPDRTTYPAKYRTRWPDDNVRRHYAEENRRRTEEQQRPQTERNREIEQRQDDWDRAHNDKPHSFCECWKLIAQAVDSKGKITKIRSTNKEKPTRVNKKNIALISGIAEETEGLFENCCDPDHSSRYVQIAIYTPEGKDKKVDDLKYDRPPCPSDHLRDAPPYTQPKRPWMIANEYDLYLTLSSIPDNYPPQTFGTGTGAIQLIPKRERLVGKSFSNNPAHYRPMGGTGKIELIVDGKVCHTVYFKFK